MVSISTAQFDFWIAQFFWPMVRILAMIAVAPMLGNRSIPIRVKVALAILVTIVAAPSLPPAPVTAIDSYPGFLQIAREILIGVSLGFAVRVVFAAVEMAGELVGLQMGLSFAGYIDPTSGGAANVISRYFGTIAVLLFLSINGHLLLIYGVIESFQTIPITLDGDVLLQGKRLLALGAELFRIALTIALPFVILLLMVNLAMGVMSRVAPQLNIFAVGFPVTLTVGMTALLLILPYLANPMTAALEKSIAVMLVR